MSFVRFFNVLASVCLVACLTAFAAPSARAEESVPDYATDIAPLLTKYCAACHEADVAEGDFVLDSYPALLKGGERGPAIVAGDAASSRLVRAITHQAEPYMPPDDNPAPKPEEIALVKAWIDAGARGPQGAEPDRKQLVVPKIEPAPQPRPVTALAWSPDGRRLAVARYQEVELLDAGTHKPLAKLDDHRGKVTSLSFSADGNLLVTGSGIAGLFGEARLWNAADGTLERVFDGHRDLIYAAVLSPDGKQLATCSYDRRAIVWNVETGKPIHTLEGHNDALYDVAFSPDGKLLATASGDATVKIWSVAAGERLDTLSQPLKEQYTVVFSPDGNQVLAGGADNRLRVWRVLSRDKPRINPISHIRYAHEGPIVQLRYSPDGKLLVSVSEDRTLKLWETQSFTQTHVFGVQPDVVHAVSFSSDGRALAVGRMDGSLEVLAIPDEATVPHAAEAKAAFGTVDGVAASGEMPPMQSTAEAEPNDDFEQATPLPLPGTAKGVIDATGKNEQPDVDLYRIECRRGQQWVLEIDAARSKSPLDSKLEVLDADGEPVPRVLLAAVRDSYITFRGIDSNERDARVFGWEEMDLGQYLYLQGEVCKTFRMPQGPDSGFALFPHDGARHCYFDTTATSHALGEPCYIVEPMPPGATPVPNGLPVFPLYYENDDDGLRRLGKDSRLTFTAPDDGVYLVRVSDVRGFQGPEFRYTLTVRPRQPDFNVKLRGAKPTVAAGSGKTFTVNLERIDEFEGAVRVELAGTPPPGFTISSPLVIEDGHLQAKGVVFASADATQPTPEQWDALTLQATARVDDAEVTKEIGTLGEVKLADKPKVLVQLLPRRAAADADVDVDVDAVEADASEAPMSEPMPETDEIVIRPGQTTAAWLKVERNGFNGRITLEVNNLPFGVIVANIGLNDVLIPEGQSERQIFLEAAPWVTETTCWIHAVAKVEGNQASAPVRFHVQGSPQRAD